MIGNGVAIPPLLARADRRDALPFNRRTERLIDVSVPHEYG